MNKLRYHAVVATFFGAGYLPPCPGTWGSLAGLLLFIALAGQPVLQIGVFFFALFAGRVSAKRIAAETRKSDPSCVVIDEVAGIFIALIFLPLEPMVFTLGFVLFRLFDIFKIPPAKLLERLSNGWGIMLDDILCGAYVNVILQTALFFDLL